MPTWTQTLTITRFKRTTKCSQQDGRAALTNHLEKLLPSPPPQPFTLISLYPFPFYPFSVFPHTSKGNQYPTGLEPRTKE